MLFKRTKTDDSVEMIQRAVQEHSPAKWIPLLSGGHDSICACHIASLTPGAPRPFEVFHIDTGIGAKYTRKYVEERCEQFGWKLNVVQSERPEDSYEQFVKDRGFPGPGRHSWVYARLKERSIQKLSMDHKIGQRPVMFITGCRRQESQRRMGYAVAVRRGDGISKTGHLNNPSRLWVAPCLEWLPADQTAYLKEYQIPRNRIKDLIGLSGECFCGANAAEDNQNSDSELEAIKAHAPDVYEEIMRLREIAKEHSQPDRWGCKPLEQKEEKDTEACPLFMDLCVGCQK